MGAKKIILFLLPSKFFWLGQQPNSQRQINRRKSRLNTCMGNSYRHDRPMKIPKDSEATLGIQDIEDKGEWGGRVRGYQVAEVRMGDSQRTEEEHSTRGGKSLLGDLGTMGHREYQLTDTCLKFSCLSYLIQLGSGSTLKSPS